ncbi:hypothetical protein HispidOSU_015042 [Sigmodon hispidus]
MIQEKKTAPETFPKETGHKQLDLLRILFRVPRMLHLVCRELVHALEAAASISRSILPAPAFETRQSLSCCSLFSDLLSVALLCNKLLSVVTLRCCSMSESSELRHTTSDGILLPTKVSEFLLSNSHFGWLGSEDLIAFAPMSSTLAAVVELKSLLCYQLGLQMSAYSIPGGRAR